MINETKLKILLLGPVSTGKTAIANFLSNTAENLKECRPTKGVRILEFVAYGVRGKGVYQNSVEVELWDCSGDNRYQSLWPAIQHKTDGIIFVYTEATNQQKSFLNTLYRFFIEESNFPEACCLILKNEYGNEKHAKTSGNPLPSLNGVNVNLEDNGAEFKVKFNHFLSSLIKASSND